MTHLVYIEASPMQAASTSSSVAAAWLEAYRQAHPGDTVDVINVWDIDLPPFDADMIAAKFAVLRAQNATAPQQALWARAVEVSQRFNAADRYLFSLPMWNFGIPYRLKHFIDVVTLPGQNWSWSRQTGYQALLSGKSATLVYSSAGAYPLPPDEDASDFQKPYMRRWLRFLDIEVTAEISAAPTLVPPEELAANKAGAVERARALASAL
ncbi:FMN-dependent NADH-azoreductase [Polaromonas sp. YR568]|uniref:FMN-dependent NADH-azoreductase n=1 Tax=Polaromonas sp. YR568 TaxID=1855301 RepID=UPI0008E742E2|nr:NAD(P)H-dependent oxidoreductase [Polaromonas sp. YR568]SFU72744.1 FMN-dependent NADH-azoreductase [Polaromonas sp. YR568]